MKLRIALFFLGALTLLFPLACQKTYSVQPLPAPTATPMPTATPTCFNPPATPTPPVSGIYWNSAQITLDYINGVITCSASLLLAVNGLPVTTAGGVTLSGPGLNVPLNLLGTSAPGDGVTYGNFMTTGGSCSGMVPNNAYTLTTNTWAGTASASVTLPSNAVIATNGVTATWAGSNAFNIASVLNSTGSVELWASGGCYSVASPYSFPATAYPSAGSYTDAIGSYNYNPVVTGGSGVLLGVTVSEAPVTIP